jgi:tRNA 2-thiouridine synthesizing protein A
VTDIILDARSLLCPLPVIRTQDAVRKLQHGQILKVLCSDPGVVHDIPAWSRVHGHEVLDILEGEDEIVIRILIRNTG